MYSTSKQIKFYEGNFLTNIKFIISIKDCNCRKLKSSKDNLKTTLIYDDSEGIEPIRLALFQETKVAIQNNNISSNDNDICLAVSTEAVWEYCQVFS